MDALMLLRRAEEVGLRVQVVGDQLKIRGPKAAEPMVRLLAEHKCEVLRALSNKVPAVGDWHARYDVLTFRWSIGRPWSGARRLAWGELQNEWHWKHGTRSPSWQCAGCQTRIGGVAAMELPDGNRVHLDPVDCLLRFGRAWLTAADVGLATFGLQPPNLP